MKTFALSERASSASLLICTSLLSVLPAVASNFDSFALAIRLIRALGKSASSMLTAGASLERERLMVAVD